MKRFHVDFKSQKSMFGVDQHGMSPLKNTGVQSVCACVTCPVCMPHAQCVRHELSAQGLPTRRACVPHAE